ncbi:ASCH domain-containing protein [Jeotgalibacillus sp. S-D1]|uniref:ASCH domain-containing protein n=1 Tax=Jeotgalibacillus sp. S-D1 TaxID=2552189 RepID=UPI0010592ECC|nr:ASCH domain-containing protein [Jeotgalibacillus sp. S-D1]TDL31089.1 ASCH domain-containing protein [Jeotgalibacillus sp. S-D1]
MNEESQKYWDEYWNDRDQTKPKKVSDWQFGASPDQLAQLVIDEVKTATCSGLIFYEIEKEPLPAIEDYSVVLSSNDKPLAIIKTVDVNIMPMNEVPEEFAIAEGEGDRTYQYWKEVHEKFFTKELNEVGLAYSEDMMLVCERFELVDVKNK